MYFLIINVHFDNQSTAILLIFPLYFHYCTAKKNILYLIKVSDHLHSLFLSEYMNIGTNWKKTCLVGAVILLIC